MRGAAKTSAPHSTHFRATTVRVGTFVGGIQNAPRVSKRTNIHPTRKLLSRRAPRERGDPNVYDRVRTGVMRDAACGLRRTPLPRTPVNRQGVRRARGLCLPFGGRETPSRSERVVARVGLLEVAGEEGYRGLDVSFVHHRVRGVDVAAGDREGDGGDAAVQALDLARIGAAGG